MPNYWLYQLDAAGRAVEPGAPYHCASDEEAAALAEMFHAEGTAVEIWREAPLGKAATSRNRPPPVLSKLPMRRTADPRRRLTTTNTGRFV